MFLRHIVYVEAPATPALAWIWSPLSFVALRKDEYLEYWQKQVDPPRRPLSWSCRKSTEQRLGSEAERLLLQIDPGSPGYGGTEDEWAITKKKQKVQEDPAVADAAEKEAKASGGHSFSEVYEMLCQMEKNDPEEFSTYVADFDDKKLV
eukprot:s1094_g12.t1